MTTRQFHVADRVAVKYDVEQRGTIEKIEVRNGTKYYSVRLFQGEYVDQRNGTLVEFVERDFF